MKAVLRCAAALAGDPVVNRAGEELGVLEHMILDLARGRLVYAIVARGGVLGLGDRLYAVPWSALERDALRDCFVADLDPAHLDAAPWFDPRHWPEMDDEWARRVHAHYGKEAYIL